VVCHRFFLLPEKAESDTERPEAKEVQLQVKLESTEDEYKHKRLMK